MSVSQGTKNLKFMQRAAARSSPSTSKPPSSTAPTSVNAPTATTRIIAGEESLQWTLPVPVAPSAQLHQVDAKGKSKAAVTIAYEQSYLPFLFDDDDGDEVDGDGNAVAGPSRGGRVVFGRREQVVVKVNLFSGVTETPSHKRSAKTGDGAFSHLP
jgi:hypothetical protein